MSDDLIQRVLKVIATSKRIPPETVTIDSDFAQLNIDSMDAVEILFALENEFELSIPDDAVRAVVEDALDVVMAIGRHARERGAAGVGDVRQMCEGIDKLITDKASEPPVAQ